MPDFFLPYENDLFFLINGSHSRFMDSLTVLFSGYTIWALPVLFLLGVLFYKKNWREWLWVLLCIALLFTLCDMLSSNIIKPLVGRPRPVVYPGIMEHVRSFEGYGKYLTGFGFISGHTTNSFGLAMFTTLLFRNRLYGWMIFCWAVVMGYSRIYLGVHFVSDVLGGMVVGVAAGCLIYAIYRFVVKAAEKRGIATPASYDSKRIKILSLGIICYIVFFSLLSPWLINIIGTL